ncbi:MAG TPA: Uma2 family endonuclease, partial [Isosphaeraceae bacterium]|nr:Uma2 family endonuclease [Isosphaeraceae bacterium]
MATASVFRPRFVNFGDVRAYLGGIPDYRIQLRPVPGEATEDDVLAVKAREGRSCELIDGILVEKDMATFESRVAFILGVYLELFIEGKHLGVILPGDGMLRLFPKQVRIPDVSFVSRKRMPGQELPKEKIWSLAPDLAVEVLSEGNTEEEMDRKLKEYFQAGTKLVWYVDPQDRTVRVYTSPRKFRLLKEHDTLDGGKVLPG